MRRLVVAIAAVGLAAIGLASTPAARGATGGTCTVLILGGTTGSLTVPPGATCELDGVTVNGSVTVQSGGTLTVDGHTHITGSVTGNTPRQIHIFIEGSGVNKIDGSLAINGSSSNAVDSEICGVTIGGSVNVSRVALPANEVSIDGDGGETDDCWSGSNGPVTIKGSVTLASNPEEVELSSATVSGSVNVINNSDGDTAGSAEIEGNTIGGTLACSGNVNGVDNGVEPNTAKTKTGQCIGK
jgi:hypothetical protein